MDREIIKKYRILLLVLSFSVISFLTKYVSEWTHEFLGHIGLGYLAGGTPLEYEVTWLWPLKFGHANVLFESDATNAARVLEQSGGILMCSLGSIISNLFIFLYFRKDRSFHYTIQGWIILHTLFWYGLWTFTNSIGYLLIGSIMNFGDIANIAYYTGISSWLFVFPGLFLFGGLYYIISINCYHLAHPLINIKTRWILFLFWCIIPILYILFFFNPSIEIRAVFFPIGFILMFIPSVFSYFTVLNEWRLWSKIIKISLTK